MFNCKTRSYEKLIKKCFMVRMKEHSWIKLLQNLERNHKIIGRDYMEMVEDKSISTITMASV